MEITNVRVRIVEKDNSKMRGFANVTIDDQFVVHDSTNARITYDINMIEVNDKNIKMLYRLKKNDSYVISNWVSVNDLKNITSTLDSSNSDTYQLEWKWPYEGNDNIDTLAGTSIDSNYKLNINVSFRAIV